MLSYEEYFDNQARQEKFAILVAARVNDIRSGRATELEAPEPGGVMDSPIGETLMFADLIARAVCVHLEKEGE